MRALPAIVLSMVAAIGGCNSCKRPTPQTLTALPDKPPVDAAVDVPPETAPPEVPTATVPPDIACTTSARVAWINEPLAQFSCSNLRTPKSAKTSFELTVSPGTEISVDLAVMNDKHLGFAPAMVRYQLEGAPLAAKVDGGKLKWRVNAPAGSTFLFQVAALVKLTEGELCAKQPIVVHVVDDDVTRAHQIETKLRRDAFFRSLDCLWGHQGPDPVENSNGDAADEKGLRDDLACGAPMVRVVMRDLDGDGKSDAIVTFTEHAPATPPTPPARWEKGPGVQIHLRKGDDFVFVGEAPGELIEADDGTSVILDTNDEEHASCPPKPYKSTGYNCPTTRVEVRKLVGARIEWVGEHAGSPSGAAATECPFNGLTVNKDAKGKLIGFHDGAKTIAWSEKTAQ